MSSTSGAKRNRSDNFDPQDVDLLLSLIEEHARLIDSAQLEDKKKGWDLIHIQFNAGCRGIKRDLPVLKMKLKNIKASSKKSKNSLEFVDTTNNEDSDEQTNNEDQEDFEDHQRGSSSNDFKYGNKRKRCKKFSKGDCDLLLQLFDKHCSSLDSSSSAHSVKKRNDAWDNLTQEFNLLQTNGISRDQGELKIKIKNLKASRIKTEPNDSPSAVFEATDQLETSTPVVKNIIHNRSLAQSSSQTQLPQRPLRIVSTTSNVDLKHNDGIGSSSDMFYDEFEVEYINNPLTKSNAVVTGDDQEIAKIRKENLLIKNSVLKKKERLLELQIALAERNLRRQI